MRPSDSAKREFATRLLARLVQLNMTQMDLAKRTGYSKHAVSTWARQRSLPTTEAMNKIAKILNCKPEDLLPFRFESPMAATVDIKLYGNGRARLRIDRELDEDLALKIAGMIHEGSKGSN